MLKHHFSCDECNTICHESEEHRFTLSGGECLAACDSCSAELRERLRVVPPWPDRVCVAVERSTGRRHAFQNASELRRFVGTSSKARRYRFGVCIGTDNEPWDDAARDAWLAAADNTPVGGVSLDGEDTDVNVGIKDWGLLVNSATKTCRFALRRDAVRALCRQFGDVAQLTWATSRNIDALKLWCYAGDETCGDWLKACDTLADVRHAYTDAKHLAQCDIGSVIWCDPRQEASDAADARRRAVDALVDADADVAALRGRKRALDDEYADLRARKRARVEAEAVTDAVPTRSRDDEFEQQDVWR